MIPRENWQLVVLVRLYSFPNADLLHRIQPLESELQVIINMKYQYTMPKCPERSRAGRGVMLGVFLHREKHDHKSQWSYVPVDL